MQADPQKQSVSPISEPAPIENQLATFLEELTVVQDELLEVLAAKRDRIAENDIAGATRLQPQAESLCDRLQACHDRRTELLAESTKSNSKPRTLGELAASLSSGKTSELTKKVQDASSRTRLLQHQSLANWVLAQRSIIHLAQMLEIIATGGQLQPTYGREQSTEVAGALVNQEA